MQYNVVSNAYFCGHVQGGYPYNCYKSLSKVAGCQFECTHAINCIGYSEGDGFCNLIPSLKHCPEGWSHGSSTYPVATNSKDLVASSLSGYNCVTKGRH